MIYRTFSLVISLVVLFLGFTGIICSEIYQNDIENFFDIAVVSFIVSMRYLII